MCVGQMSTFIQLLCASILPSKRRSEVQGQSPWSGEGVRELICPAPKAKIFKLFGSLMEVANLPFLIFRDAKNHKVCCLAKMALNRSHLGMRIVIRGHFIIIKKFFMEGGSNREQRQGHRGTAVPLPLWRHPWPCAIMVSATDLVIGYYNYYLRRLININFRQKRPKLLYIMFPRPASTLSAIIVPNIH